MVQVMFRDSLQKLPQIRPDSPASSTVWLSASSKLEVVTEKLPGGGVLLWPEAALDDLVLLQSRGQGDRAHRLIKGAQTVATRFRGNVWIVSSVIRGKNGIPRPNTSHDRGFSIDIAPVDKEQLKRATPLWSPNAKNPLLGQLIPPMWFAVKHVLPEGGVSLVFEGDHLHLQDGPMPAAVYSFPGYRPGIYAWDDLYSSVQVPPYVMRSDGSLDLVNHQDWSRWRERVLSSPSLL